ncbi:MAG: thymidine phosphorylase [Acidimicrobiia bacterium]|nr:thymidine phosphorylase [Acidimicrobiia bacterium]
MSAPTVTDLIAVKRDGGPLSDDDIKYLIAGYTDGSIPDYQMAAMTMAIYIRGLDADELSVWTDAMLHSGDVLDLSRMEGPTVDKHSTGGVGDKVSIPLAPIVAACGVNVPMMSGRGLGHTGGTLDKLETIPGFTTSFDATQFEAILADTGLVLAGQSERLVPADRKLYALRDTTATVSSIPLISSSIMSKKLAEDLDGLVLDVKVGSGAFMTESDDARRLAETMVGIGAAHDVTVSALITAMDQPLGRAVGNANEIAESLDVLAGGGPDDLVEITKTLAREMLRLAHVDETKVDDAITSGRAMEKLAEVISAQGGNPAVTEDRSLLPLPEQEIVIEATDDGFVTRCDARTIGVAAMRLGAGRRRKGDDIDPAVGIRVEAKLGDRISVGDPLAVVGVRNRSQFEEIEEALLSAWSVEEYAPEPRSLIVDRVGDEL